MSPGGTNHGSCQNRSIGMYIGGPYFLYRELFDTTPSKEDAINSIAPLDLVESTALLCRINADLRLIDREPGGIDAMQQTLAGSLLDDQTIARLKERYGSVRPSSRPLFHTPQILNVMKLALSHCAGDQKPYADPVARYRVGASCLITSDLLVNADEEIALRDGPEEDRTLALMMQTLGMFEVVNVADIAHILYRSRVMFKLLLEEPRIVARIRDCGKFDFQREFEKATGVALSHWIFIVFGIYAYLGSYLSADGSRHEEYTAIDNRTFRTQSRLSENDLTRVLTAISLPLERYKAYVSTANSPTDQRIDFTCFRSKPLIALTEYKYHCLDVGFLLEKMHSGVYWAIHDTLSRERRFALANAWGILFEEYINWFLRSRQYTHPLSFHPAPKWEDGTESFDGVWIRDTRFVPMEYKGGFLKLEARYSGDVKAFKADLLLKIGKGCKQLATKIESLFHIEPLRRRRVVEFSSEGFTRVVPVLVVQDQILRSPLVNWMLNKHFNSLLDRSKLRPGLTVDALTVASIHEIETMAESAEGGSFDILEGLQLRCFRDPDMSSDLHNFLFGLPGYGKGKTARYQQIFDQHWLEMKTFMFGDQFFE